MTYDFDREGQPGFPPAAVLSDRNFIYSDHLDCDADAFVENRELREMYEVICQCFEGFRENSPFPGWYVDTFARIKKAESFLCGLCREGELVSTAGVYNISPVSAMISSVATLPAWRGQGLALAVHPPVPGICALSGLHPLPHRRRTRPGGLLHRPGLHPLRRAVFGNLLAATLKRCGAANLLPQIRGI